MPFCVLARFRDRLTKFVGLNPSNTGTTFDNYPVSAGSTYSYYVTVRLTTGGTMNSNTVAVSIPTNVCR